MNAHSPEVRFSYAKSVCCASELTRTGTGYVTLGRDTVETEGKGSKAFQHAASSQALAQLKEGFWVLPKSERHKRAAFYHKYTTDFSLSMPPPNVAQWLARIFHAISRAFAVTQTARRQILMPHALLISVDLAIRAVVVFFFFFCTEM